MHARRRGLPRQEEERVEPLPLLPGEVLLRGAVEVLQVGGAGAPLEVVAELVGQRVPRLLPPVEAGREPGQRREGPVVEDDAALHRVGRVAVVERDALAQGVDLRPGGVRQGAGGDDHLGHPLEEVGRDLLAQPADQGAEVVQPHGQAASSAWERSAMMSS